MPAMKRDDRRKKDAIAMSNKQRLFHFRATNGTSKGNLLSQWRPCTQISSKHARRRLREAHIFAALGSAVGARGRTTYTRNSEANDSERAHSSTMNGGGLNECGEEQTARGMPDGGANPVPDKGQSKQTAALPPSSPLARRKEVILLIRAPSPSIGR